MPNYEYECTRDASRFELWQEVGSPPPSCPDCGAETKKIFHVPRVIFKGSGFYLTDLRAEQGKNGGAEGKSEAKNGGAETKTEAASNGEAKAETTSQTKPETPKAAGKSEAFAASSSAVSSSATPAPASPPAKSS